MGVHVEADDEDFDWRDWHLEVEDVAQVQFQTDCECYTRDFEVCVGCGHSSFCRLGDCSHDGEAPHLQSGEIPDEDEEEMSVEEIVQESWYE
jgi:hypothetical protein